MWVAAFFSKRNPLTSPSCPPRDEQILLIWREERDRAKARRRGQGRGSRVTSAGLREGAGEIEDVYCEVSALLMFF